MINNMHKMAMRNFGAQFLLSRVAKEQPIEKIAFGHFLLMTKSGSAE